MSELYSHLNENDRILLAAMINKGYSKNKIATILKVHRSTIYREIKRNIWLPRDKKESAYLGGIAQRKYLKRRKRSLKLEKEKTLRLYVQNKLKLGWSPWQIEGRLKIENGIGRISHETIYRYIYSNYNRRSIFYRFLRRKHCSRIKQGTRRVRIPNILLIENRPDIINSRKEFGHWECDLMMFGKGKNTNLITLTERMTRFTIAIKNTNKKASSTALNLISTLKFLKPYIKSITFDQGSEFARFDWIKDCMKAKIYFCEAGSPYQKGSIENRNGVLRVELPRTYDIASVTQRNIDKLIRKINNRPMKCLGFLSPKEVFNNCINVAA